MREISDGVRGNDDEVRRMNLLKRVRAIGGETGGVVAHVIGADHLTQS